MNSFSPDIVSEISLFIFYFAPFPRWPHSSRLSPHIYSFIFLSLPCLMFNRYKTKLSPMWANLKWVSKVLSCNTATHTLPPAPYPPVWNQHCPPNKRLKSWTPDGGLSHCNASGRLSQTFIDKLDVFRYQKFNTVSVLTVYFLFQKEIADSFRKTEIFWRSPAVWGERQETAPSLSLSLLLSLSSLLVDRQVLLSEKRFEK